MTTRYKILALLPIVACSAAVYLTQNSQTDIESKPLPLEEWANVYGGMEVQSFNDPSNGETFYTDNVPIDVALRHELTNDTSIIVETKVNNTKVDSFVVSTPTLSGDWRYGTLKSRIEWPLGEGPNSTLTLRYCDINLTDCDVDPEGPDTKTSLSLPSSVKVIKVWFHNMRFQGPGGEQTALTEAKAKLIVDNLEYAYSHETTAAGQATDSIDAIMEQCGTSNRTQFRFHALDTVDTLTINPVGDQTGNEQLFYDTMFKHSSVEYYTNLLDPQKEYMHVFIAKSIGRHTHGTPEADYFLDGVAERDAPNAINAIIVKEPLNNFKMTNLILHEMGHSIADLDHVDTASAPCGPFSNDELDLSPRNVMCGSRYAGRQITQSQCDGFYQLPIHSLTNFNN